MKTTLTSKGQITIPKAIRERLGLKPGDQLEFDENASGLSARRIVDKRAWSLSLRKWKASRRKNLKGHPWDRMNSKEILEELRGPVEAARKKKKEIRNANGR